MQYKGESPCEYDHTQRMVGLSGGTDFDSVFSSEADICIDEMVTAIVLTDQLNHPVAVLGTSDGQLMKVKAQVNYSFCFLLLPQFHAE